MGLGNLDQIKVSDGDGNTIQRLGRYEKVRVGQKEEHQQKSYTVALYVGKDISAYQYSDVAEKTLRYWGQPPINSIGEAYKYDVLCLSCPIRPLSNIELSVFLKMKETRKVVVFAGSDLTSFNLVLDQLGSIFEAYPSLDYEAKQITVNSPDGGTLFLVPGYWWGWLAVRRKYDNLASVADPLGHGLLFNNIVNMQAPFYAKYPDGATFNGGSIPFAYWFGSEFLAALSGPSPSVTWSRATLATTNFYPEEWSTLSLAEIKSWLSGLGSGIIQVTPPGYVLATDSKGHRIVDPDIEDRGSSSLAYRYGSNLIVASFSPLWFEDLYVPAYDSTYEVREFSRWIANGSLSNTDVFQQPFVQYVPFSYSITT
jgi:hypothetical protein